MKKQTRNTGTRSPVTRKRDEVPPSSLGICSRCGRNLDHGSINAAGKQLCSVCREQLGPNG